MDSRKKSNIHLFEIIRSKITVNSNVEKREILDAKSKQQPKTHQ